MRKLMLLAAMVAMVLAITIPAMASNTGGDQFATGCIAVQNVEQNVDAVATGGAGGDASANIAAEQFAFPVAIDYFDFAFFGDAGSATATANQAVVAAGGDASGGDAVNVVALEANQTQNCDSEITQKGYVGDVK